MPTTVTPKPPEDVTQPESSELELLRQELHRQGDEIHAAQRSFSIFAVLAFLLAMATLLAVAFKLDAKNSAKTSTPAAAAKPAAKPAAALGGSVAVGLGEFYVRPSVAAAASGRVHFAVRNGGAVTHEFVVLRTNKKAADLLQGSRADESGNVGETGDLAPGASKAITLKLAAGHYALICNLPGHYKAGQYADFTVR